MWFSTNGGSSLGESDEFFKAVDFAINWLIFRLNIFPTTCKIVFFYVLLRMNSSNFFRVSELWLGLPRLSILIFFL